MGLADPERDFVHPDGVRGCLAPLGIWSLGTVLDLLLPPLQDPADPAEQRRWRHRAAHADPYLVDLRRHGPGHEVWRSRVLDLAEVRVPVLCVSGWRDIFCGGAVHAYEQLGGPKKLLVGPWTHTMPHEAPVSPVDFHGLAMRWWDRWLSGSPNGVEREPPVTVYVQGDEPGWRHFASWPPPAKVDRYAGAELSPPNRDAPTGSTAVAAVRVDPTVGALSGMWGIPTGGYGFPLDQHGDDLASLAVTGRPLEQPLLVLGRPVVTVGVSGGPRRLVVRLADVDPRGRSTMITGGLLARSPAPGDPPAAVELEPTCYRVPAGHRLRVTVADGAFPRLWPVAAGAELGLDRVALALPVSSAAEGQPASVPPPGEAGGGLWVRNQPRWEIRHDPINQEVAVVMGGSATCADPGRAHRIELDSQLCAAVRRDAPELATVRGASTTTVHMGTGERVVVRIDLHSTESATTVTGSVTVDGDTVAERRWHT
jgi:predicted acyl esterase